MRNLKMILFLFLGLGLFSCAQDNGFKQRNDDRVDARSAEDDEDEIEGATEEENEVEIDVAQLPQPVLDALKSKYTGASLKEADKITQSDGSITYDIEIRIDGEVIEVMYDDEGNFLGEEADND